MSNAADSIGTVAEAGLFAREIERRRGGKAGDDHDPGGPCANCGTQRVGPYCHSCGQLGHIHRTLMALVHDIGHGVFHFEGKIWTTLPMLAWRPGELTRRYIHGERARFVSPMALFLFSVFLMFAVVSNIGHHKIQPMVIADGKASTLEAEQTKLGAKLASYQAARSALPSGSQEAAKLDSKIKDVQDSINALKVPAKVQSIIQVKDDDKAGQKNRDDLKVNGFDTGLGWFDRLVSHTARNPELAAYKLKTYGYKYSWVLVPISLPFIWMLFCFRRDVGLYDHAIFSIYSIAFMSLGVVVLVVAGAIGMPKSIIALTAIFVPPVHMYKQLKGAYLLGRFGAAWRTFALLIITSIALSLFLSFIVYMGSD